MIEVSAGGVVYKKKGNQYLWLVIKPAGKEEWRLPKGHIEKDEAEEDAALREVEEETGIRARIISRLGEISYFYTLFGRHQFKRVTFFLMEVIEEGKLESDSEVEEILWLPFSEAYQRLTFKKEKEILARAAAQLQ